MLQHQVTEPRIISIPVSRLNPIAHGVRKTNGVSVEDLAASIRAEGLIQNLTVIVDPDAPLAGAEEFQQYQVIAGSRRLKALRKLIADNHLPEDHAVHCRVIDASQALTVSTAENTIRVNMHPADEFTAFREMIDAGRSIEEIAARFGVTPLVVQRRLKLANVSPKIFEEFRNDRIKLDQVMALAIVDDHKAQEKAWFKTPEYNRSAASLRAILTQKEIDASTDPIARFVGLVEYEQAGGVVHRDLFSDRTGAGYISDPLLLRQLATDKLERIAHNVRGEGWSWVEVRETCSWSELSDFTRVDSDGRRKPTDVQRKRTTELETERKALDKEFTALQEIDRELIGDDLERYHVIEDRLGDIHAELENMDEERRTWSPKILSKGGAIIAIEDGSPKIHRGLVKGKLRQDKDASKQTKQAKAKKIAAGAGHSDALVRELSAVASLAISAELIANPGAALIVLTHRLVLNTFYRSQLDIRSVSEITSRDSTPQLTDLGAPNAKGNPDLAKLASEEKALRAMLPTKSAELLDFLKTAKNLSRFLAYCTAVSINAIVHSETSLKSWPARDIAEGLQLNMRTRWTVNGENYLDRVSAAHVTAALAEAGADKATLASTEKMKKAELVKTAQPILAATNWIPKPLRFEVSP